MMFFLHNLRLAITPIPTRCTVDVNCIGFNCPRQQYPFCEPYLHWSACGCTGKHFCVLYCKHIFFNRVLNSAIPLNCIKAREYETASTNFCYNFQQFKTILKVRAKFKKIERLVSRYFHADINSVHMITSKNLKLIFIYVTFT